MKIPVELSVKFLIRPKFAFSVLILLSLSACTTLGPNLVESGQTSVETVDSDKTSIVKVNVNADEDNAAIVKGLVVRDSSQRFAKGYVTVDLYNEQGTRIDSVDAQVVYKRKGAKLNRVGTFRANLDETPPMRSKVIVRSNDKRKPAEPNAGEGVMEIL